MADNTNLFKAVVKTVRSRLRSQGFSITPDNSILKSSQPQSDFATKTKEVLNYVTKLNEFLMDNRVAYMQINGLFESNTDLMSDTDRDKINIEFEKFNCACLDNIKSLKHDIHSTKQPQFKEHQEVVIGMIEAYLKSVSRLHSDLKSTRTKKLLDRRNMARLGSDKLKKMRENNNMRQENKQTNGPSTLIDEDSINNGNTIESWPQAESTSFDEDEPLSAAELQMFERENEQLYGQMNDLGHEVKQIESKVVEISRLQEVFADEIITQDKNIDQIGDTVVGTTENIKEANEEIREAMKNNAGLRVWILFFLIVATFSLHFLDWYNP